MKRPSNRSPGRAIPLLALVLVTVALVPLTGQERLAFDDAERWLAANETSPQRARILLQAVQQAPSTADIERLLSAHAASIDDQEVMAAVYHEAAAAHELVNAFSRATQYYARALSLDATRWDTALRRAALALEIGERAEAVVLLTSVVSRADDRTTQRRAAIQRARAWLLSGEVDRAVVHLESMVGNGDEALVEPELLLLLHEAAVTQGNGELEAFAVERMGSLAPVAPERDLMGAEPAAITFYPTPSRILGTLEYAQPAVTTPQPSAARTDDTPGTNGASAAEPAGRAATDARTESAAGTETAARAEPAAREIVFGVQTGSFRDRENAQFMARDIEALGFPAVIRTIETDSGRFYRVIVPLGTEQGDGAGRTVGDAQEFVVRLKERGIEGFLIFSE